MQDGLQEGNIPNISKSCKENKKRNGYKKENMSKLENINNGYKIENIPKAAPFQNLEQLTKLESKRKQVERTNKKERF